jgi:hypothetical protein
MKDGRAQALDRCTVDHQRSVTPASFGACREWSCRVGACRDGAVKITGFCEVLMLATYGTENVLD